MPKEGIVEITITKVSFEILSKIAEKEKKTICEVILELMKK